MGRQPQCSVVIPTYNRMGLLARTLDCLTRQDIGTDAFEVLVVDDGSSDATAELVASFRNRLDLRYFFQPDEGYRVAAARNIGIAHATAPVCVFVDSGVLLHSHALAAHLHTQAGPEPVAAIGYVFCFDHGDEDAREMLATLDFDDVDATIETLRAEGRWLDVREGFYARCDDALHDLPAPWLWYWTCNVSARTAQLRSIGGFDEAFRCWGGEDTDLGYRLHRDGARFVLDRAAGAIHYPHAKNHEQNNEIQQQNLRYIAHKYDTPITRLLIAEPPIMFSDMDDYIRANNVPTCAEYLARTSISG